MRMLLKASIPTEAGNAGIRDGSMMENLGSILEDAKPEAVYFFIENGKRTCLMIFDMNEVTIPAEGVMPYQYHVTEMNIEEDLYVQSLEVLPGNRKVVHHVIVFLQPPPAVANAMKDGVTNTMLDVYAPGSPPGGP